LPISSHEKCNRWKVRKYPTLLHHASLQCQHSNTPSTTMQTPKKTKNKTHSNHSQKNWKINGRKEKKYGHNKKIKWMNENLKLYQDLKPFLKIMLFQHCFVLFNQTSLRCKIFIHIFWIKGSTTPIMCIIGPIFDDENGLV
jgi:hypothetical protein